MSRIIWSAPDGSWGECDNASLIVMDVAELFDNERATLLETDEREVRRIMEQVEYDRRRLL